MSQQPQLPLPPPAPLAAAATRLGRAGRRRRPLRPIWLVLLLLLLLLLVVVAPSIARGAHDDDTQLFSHQFTLPEDSVARGLAHVGDGRRIRSVLKSLSAGRAVHLGVIGGSITWGHGVKVGEEDWFSVTAANLARAFPRANVSHFSGALAATTSAFATPSIPKLVRPECDLVFAEYTVNDGWEDEPPMPRSERARSFERTLRALLSLPRRPAVVLMHSFPSNASRAGLPFWASEEDAYGVLAQYYSVPSLSMRDAIWHDYAEAALLLQRAQAQADARERARTGNATAVAAGTVDPGGVLTGGLARLRPFATWEVHQLDERHPTRHGQRMMADLVMGLLQHEFVRAAVRGARAAGARGGGGAAADDDEQEDEEEGGAAFAVHDARRALPPPMFAGNDAGAVALQCLLGKELARVAVQGLVAEPSGGGGGGGGGTSQTRAASWRLVNDGDARKAKWGLAADAPGAELVLELDTRVAGRGGKEGAATGGAGATPPAAAAAAAAAKKVARDNARRRRLRRRSLSGWWSLWETSSAAAAAAAAARDAPRPHHSPEAAAAAAPDDPPAPPMDAELWIGVTRSWRGQGAARVACAAPCRCGPFALRAHDAGRKVTQNYVERVPVSQAERCRVVVTLPEGADGAGPDGGRRVKLVGVTVASSLPGAAAAAAAAGGGC